MQLIYPEPLRKLRASPEYLTEPKPEAKHWWATSPANTLPALGGATASITVPNAMQFSGWTNVMGSGAVSIGAAN